MMFQDRLIMRYCTTILFIVILSNLVLSQRTYQIKDSTDTERIKYLNYLVKKLDHDNAILDSLILNTPLNPELSNYYKNIYKAEDYIMQLNYEKAAETYQTAFSFLEYPFKQDLDFALKCEIYSSRNHKNINKYIWHLLKKNEDKNRFLNDSTYYTLDNWSDIKNMVDTVKSSISITLLDSLSKILEDDQAFRMKYPNRTDSQLREMGVVDSINYYKIIDIINMYPNISEELVGVKGFYVLSVIFIHSKERFDAFIKIIPHIHNGNIDARLFVDFLSNSLYLCENLYFINPTGNYSLSGIVSMTRDRDEILREYQYDKKDEKIVNKFRKKLYCENIDKLNKKIIWQFKNHKYNDYYFKFNRLGVSIAFDGANFFNNIKYKNNVYGYKFKIYYRSKKDMKRLHKFMKEYYKNNPVNDTNTE